MIFKFTTISTANVGSIQFQYCSNSPIFVDPCTVVTGLDVSGATINSQTGISGFSVSGSSSPSNLIITRTPSPETPAAVNIDLNNVVNPSTPNEVDYVRISVFTGSNATGSVVDSGSVVFVVENRYDVEAYVPPYLTFCVGVNVALDCSSTTGFLSTFGELSSSETRYATSQFSVSTNDNDGYNTYLNGQTMTSGNNVISEMVVKAASQASTSQFGINLRSNTTPFVGADLQKGPVANGFVDPDYNTPNMYKFNNGDRLAGSLKPSGFDLYTVSYIVNVPVGQQPGNYATTLIYTSIATF